MAEKEEQLMDIATLKEMNISKLTQIAKDLDVPGATGMRKQELIFKIFQAQTEKSGLIFSEGVLETLPDGFGFLPELLDNCAPLADDDAGTRGMCRPHDLPPRKPLPGLPRLMPIAD